MKRTKRFTIRRVALGLAVAAIVAPAAQAEPMGSYERQTQSTEIPYLSHGVGVSNVDFTRADQASAQSAPAVEIPYLSQGVGVSHMDFDRASQASGKVSGEIAYLSHGGGNVSIAPDDMGLSKPTNAGSPSVAATSDGWDVGPTTVSIFAVAFALLAGSLLAVRHTRRTRLSPA
jgi:hypothetical protein